MTAIVQKEQFISNDKNKDRLIFMLSGKLVQYCGGLKSGKLLSMLRPLLLTPPF